ncbi:hypothetical protein ACT45A_15260 [Salmonella enterica]|uniref:hypothetical protein n=1 Tax=Salmonella enterica TaxID=28901 RepID=UPI004036EA03
MAELTKEWLKQTIAEYEANRDELPFGLDTNSAIELQAFKLALASLEAEPVAYIFKHPAGKLFWALTDESNKDQSDVIPVYAAPPVPVVPEEKPMPNPLKMYAVDAVAAIAEVRGWNACRAAMLQAEPVSQTYKSQHTQFEQVADLYEMQFDDGRTCAFHTDAQKAAQWLQACDGNRVQEYVKLERLQNALSGNSPVIPDDWVMVPKESTQAMIKAWLSEVANFRGHAAGYKAALAAAPQREVK